MKSAWGKTNRVTGESHHLANHSADVSAVFLALMTSPAFKDRGERALGRKMTADELECLAALVFLHDVGKLAPGFQAKAWPIGHGLEIRGHLQAGWHWVQVAGPEILDVCSNWSGVFDWFMALLAHHGRPVAQPSVSEAGPCFPATPDYDWRSQEALIGRALKAWFPASIGGRLPPPSPRFLHFICGMITLADWVGSDAQVFQFEADFREDYWQTANERARQRVSEIGLGGAPKLAGPPSLSLISDHHTPRPAQTAIGQVPTSERLVLLEAETGSGKTEAALWRFAALLAAGEVDAMYFAVPTRSAARQLHARVNGASARMFSAPVEAVLAIPGQVLAGEARGQRLPDFTTLWDDGKANPTRWAAEHSARFLAARLAVGTVDQVALGGLQVKFAHLRGASLSRALLVIDEVHASDPYMTEVQTAFADDHLALGGHVLLMSATLGAAARRKWRKERPVDLATDAARAYPAIWTSAGMQPVAAEAATAKTVSIAAHSGWSGAEAARLAEEAASDGARVLVIRNTVARAQETYGACEKRDLLLTVAGHPTLHHSRFAVEDRALLDLAVEQAIGKDSPVGGRIVIGTQTLEQSLDLCADLLITDLCPMDVLLQRIGRLHRHRRPRPKGFETARVIVLCPPNGLAPLAKAAENGLGAFASGPSLSGVYVDLSGLAATLDQIQTQDSWTIPAMNRALVEAATHPDALSRVAERYGWQAYDQRVRGRALAEMRAANLRTLDRTAPLTPFPEDEIIRTRLGEEGAVLDLQPGTVGAFGQSITRIALPAQWSRGLKGDEVPQVSGAPLRVTVSDLLMTYGPEGLSRLKN